MKRREDVRSSLGLERLSPVFAAQGKVNAEIDRLGDEACGAIGIDKLASSGMEATKSDSIPD